MSASITIVQCYISSRNADLKEALQSLSDLDSYAVVKKGLRLWEKMIRVKASARKARPFVGRRDMTDLSNVSKEALHLDPQKWLTTEEKFELLSKMSQRVDDLHFRSNSGGPECEEVHFATSSSFVLVKKCEVRSFPEYQLIYI